MRKLIRKIIYKLYVIGKFEADKVAALARKKEIMSKAVVAPSTVISSDSLIYNETGDNTKIQIGENCLVRGSLLVYNHGGNITIGDDCFIGEDTRIWSASKISIGSRVLISHNVNVHDNNSHPLSSNERHVDFREIFKSGLREKANYNEKPIVIEDDVWIGFNSTIMKGVRIGRGAIIGACTLITEDVAPFSIMAGNPPRLIKFTD